MRPIIAITCQRRAAGAVFKVEPALVVISDYIDAVWRAGGLPVPVFPPTGVAGRPDDQGAGVRRELADEAAASAVDLLDTVHGVIAIGGLDVDPSRYGQEPDATVIVAPVDQEEFELALISAAIGAKLPLLAICRGAQLLNVALDGTLHQHITGLDGLQPHGVPNGGGGSDNEYQLASGSLAERVMGGSPSGRCHHHQAIDRVAPGLVVTGRTADGTVEVMELEDPTSWMLAVQWHPEETAAVDPANQALFDSLVAAAAQFARETNGISTT